MSAARKDEVAKANTTLRRLLRTPKTRAGLIAAVKSKDISRNYVYGWLTDQVRSGKVVVLKSGVSVMYQGASYVVQEVPESGNYPEWLEPRWVPSSESRRVFLDGREVDPRCPSREEEQEEE